MNTTRIAHSSLLVLALFTGAAAQPEFYTAMITELSWGDPDGVEITNFSASPQDLTQWYLTWYDGISYQSGPLGVVIQPGEIIVVKEPGGALPEVPPGTRVLEAFPGNIATTSESIWVSLRGPFGLPRDVVHVSDTSGSSTFVPTADFRGLATRSMATGVGGAVSVERIGGVGGGLDSNSGADWTEQAGNTRSFGLENRNSGPRGTDSLGPVTILINEIDPTGDYIELYNPSGFAVFMNDWFLLISRFQGDPPVVVRPFPNSFNVPSGGHAVIGTGGPPAELSPGTPYADTNLVGTSAVHFFDDEFSCALYDRWGRCVDLVRTTGDDDNVVHNHPRLPARWQAFRGAAGRNQNGGHAAIGRDTLSADTDRGSDWFPIFQRTMGGANDHFTGLPGSADRLDVRLHESPLGDGMTLVVNAGPGAAGGVWSFLFSLGHADGHGTGPGGLGPDALWNWINVSLGAGFSGVLDARGSDRIDLPSGTLPPNLMSDCIFLVQLPGGGLRLTPIIEYDT